MSDESILVFHLRAARKRARSTAALEAQTLLSGLGATAQSSGPLSDLGSVFWLSLPERNLDQARTRLLRLGYSTRVDALRAMTGPCSRAVRWRGRDFALQSLYAEDPTEAREAAPDRRPFAVKVDGKMRQIAGYRGDGGALSRRGLPAYDARLLVNLAWSPRTRLLLDPLAGAGGILREAVASGLAAASCDNDAWLRYGLGSISLGGHTVADCLALPFADGIIGAVATEPPFDPRADEAVSSGLCEIHRVLQPGGRVSMLCAERQAPGLGRSAEAAGLRQVHREDIDRKGTACTVFVWEKA